MKMKKCLSVFLVLILVFSLIGCSKKKDETEDTSASEGVSTDVETEPTEAPTVAPTAEPTPEPTPVPEIAEKDAKAVIEFEAFDASENLVTEDCSDENGGKSLGGITNGSNVMFGKVNFGEGGFGKIVVRASSGMELGGDIEIHQGAIDGTLLGTIHIDGTGDWANWQTFEADLPDLAAVTGLQDIYMVCTNGGDYLFNLNWFQFMKGPRDASKRIEVEDFDEAFDVAVEGNADEEGAMGIGGVNNGDYAAFSINFGEGGYEGITFRASSAMENGGDVEVRLNSIDGDLLGTGHINGTGDWSKWETFSFDIDGLKDLTGVQKVYFVFTNGGDWLFNINWFKLNAAPLSAKEAIEAEAFVEAIGDIAVEGNADTEGAMGIGGINNDDGTAYNVDFGKGGYKKVTFRASSAMDDGGNVDFHLGSVDGQLLGSCKVNKTGDWSIWESFSADMPDLASITGEQTIYLVYNQGGDWLFNVNWFQFEK
ncbi:MAG: glycosyl hydrolase [Herbinix sp.]|jgi:hypothetical protein|nr:glycosyl hydrolase [Herbinix sp.]